MKKVTKEQFEKHCGEWVKGEQDEYGFVVYYSNGKKSTVSRYDKTINYYLLAV